MNHQKFSNPLWVIIFLLLCCQWSQPASAFWGGGTTTKIIKWLGKIEGALPETQIDELARMIQKTGDLKQVKTLIGKMNLPETVLEDTYMRIALAQRKLDKVEAEKMFTNLSGVPGFRHNLSVISGVAEAGTKGALHELRVANQAKEYGFDVLSIRKLFDDGIKSHTTDIDLLLKKGERTFVIESKAYDSVPNTEKMLGDAQTLLEYAKQAKNEKVTPVFLFTNEPSQTLRTLLQNKGVQIIVGTPESQITELKLLAEILQ